MARIQSPLRDAMSYSISFKPQLAIHEFHGQEVKVIAGPPIMEVHGDIAQEVVKVIHNYKSIFGRKPTNLYVGNAELDLILSYPNPMYFMQYLDASEYGETFLGLKVHRVYDTTHLSVSE